MYGHYQDTHNPAKRQAPAGMTKAKNKNISKNNKKNMFYDKYTENKHFKRENT